MNRSIKKMGYFLGLATLGFFTLNCPKSSSGNSGAALLALLGGSQPGVYISGTLVDGAGAPLVGATVQILGRGESSVTILPNNWAKNDVTTSKYYMTSSNLFVADKTPSGFLYNNSSGAGSTAGDGSVCDGGFNATSKVNTTTNCPGTYIAKASTVFAATPGTNPAADFVLAQCGSSTVAQINGWSITPATSGFVGQYFDGSSSINASSYPLAYSKNAVRIYCDVSTLEAGAFAVGINTNVQADGTPIATFVTGAGGSFHTKLDVASVGNTYKVIVTPSGGSPLKTRRLRIAKNGVATLLAPVSEKPGNAPLELSTGKDITSTESSWTSLFSGGNVIQPGGSYDFSFSSVTIDMIYPKNGTQISGTLSSDLHLTKGGSPYVLSGTVIVPSGITLTIDAGVTIYGAVAPAGALLIKPGGKIFANGTSAEPILFTSSKDAGSRAPADWQGIIIQGHGVQTFGGYGSTAIGEGDTGSFGGNNNADNSGNLTYVVVQFAGAPFSPGNERNCISLMGVGSGTSLDHVQCHRGFDDGFEQWGGAFNAKYLISSGNRDDQFDFADGFIGKYQFAISHLYADAIAVNDDTSRCIEGDGNSALSCSSSARSAGDCADPYFANVTCVGAGTGIIANQGDAIFVRRATAAGTYEEGDYTHFLVDHHGNAKVLGTEGSPTAANARATWVLYRDTAPAAGSTFGSAANVTLSTTCGVTDSSTTAPNYFPACTSGSLPTPGTDTPSVTNFSGFDSANYYGAIDPAGTDWTTGWAQFPAN